eukprot:802138-Pleurochrysis_carterae.AAC.3
MFVGLKSDSLEKLPNQEEYLVAQKSKDSRQVHRTLRRVSLHGGKLIPKGRDETSNKSIAR